MPITQITLENFKGVGEAVTVPLRPITLLFGANSAGKSTLLQALLYLRELLENQNPDADVLQASGDSINIGGFRQFVHGHDLSKTVRIGVTVTVDDDGLPDYPVPGSEQTSRKTMLQLQMRPLVGVKTACVLVDIAWHSDTGRPWIVGYSVEINGQVAGRISALPTLVPELRVMDMGCFFDQLLPPEDAGDHYDMVGEEVGAFSGLTFRLGPSVVPSFGRAFSVFESLDDELYVHMTDEQARYIFSHVFVGAGELVLRELKRIRYIGPIREVPSRSFAAQRTPDQSRWADGSAAWDWVHLKPEFLTKSTAKEIRSLGLGYRIEPHRTFGVPADSLLGMLIELARLGDVEAFAELDVLPTSELKQIEEHSRVRIVAEETGVEVAPSDIGVGVAQVLPVVIGSIAPGYSVLAVEQPELHVHPAVQTRLADVLARQVVETQDRLLLLETHSEHLMLRLLRRVREHQEGESEPGAPEIKPEDLSVLYLSNEGGSVKITELPVTPDGDFSRPWPKGFFEERSAELF
jgi:hypothetical protein